MLYIYLYTAVNELKNKISECKKNNNGQLLYRFNLMNLVNWLIRIGSSDFVKYN